MATDYTETEEIINLILGVKSQDPTKVLHLLLKARGKTAPEFYDGVIKHGVKMKFNSDQWFEFHRKIMHWRLLNEKALMSKLSEKQREQLGIT